MNNLILYAIIIFIIYYLILGAGKEGYSDEEKKLIDEGIKAYKDYEKETNPIKKKELGEKLTEKYDALLSVNPHIFDNGIPDDIKRRMIN